MDRSLYSEGLQADMSYDVNDQHTVRGGLTLLDEYVMANTTTTVFSTPGGTPVGAAFPIQDNSHANAVFGGIYLQDEWKILPKVTINYGARWDIFYASFDKENPAQPPGKSHLHAHGLNDAARGVFALFHRRQRWSSFPPAR